MSAAPDIEERLVSTEKAVAALTSDMTNLVRMVQDLTSTVKGVGRPNYAMLGVTATCVIGIGSMAAAAIFGPIKAAEKRADSLDGRITALRNEHAAWLLREGDRNNRLEFMAGRTEMIHDLYLAGRIGAGD